MDEAVKLLIAILKPVIFGPYPFLEKFIFTIFIFMWFLIIVGVVSIVIGFCMAFGARLINGH